jgi:hypothetical protein
VGATLVRVLGMCRNIANFNPTSYPNYLTSLAPFAAVVAGAGLDLEFTVFADAQDVTGFSDSTSQKAWLRSVRDQLAGSANVVLELVNEGFQNGVDFTKHARPVGILSAADAQAAPNASPADPPWDYVTVHPPRDAEWMRKAKDAMEFADQFGRPAISDEPMGADEIDIGGKRSNNPDDFYYFGGVAMLLAGGATFHSSDGITSDLLRPITRNCANSFFTAINAIPDNVLSGRYTRGGLGDLPIVDDGTGALRSYCRYTDHDACVVRVRPTAPNVATGGWTITSSTGPNNCLIILSK